MNRYVRIKIIVCFFMVGSYFLLPKYGFTAFDGSVNCDVMVSHLLYPFSHANIWHLAANMLCLFMLRCRLHLLVTYIIAVISSFFPTLSVYDLVMGTSQEVSTMGFSGILFAMVGISWGRIHHFRDMLWHNKWILIIPAFIPHINFLIHLYCLLLGYLYGTSRCLKSRLCEQK